MWQFQIETIRSDRILKYQLESDCHQLTYLEVIQLWQSDRDFQIFFNSLLARCPFAAYFWETPPITSTTVNKVFEFVLVKSDRLQKVSPNSQPFKQYLASAAGREIVVFPNLGNDAKLIVPCPRDEHSTYTHIANFARQAPQSQQQVLWQTVGEVIHQNLNSQPIWISTSGLGVYWLHIRLDSYPKYYSYQPYK